MPRIDAQTASCHVLTFKEGLLSPIAHDLRIRVTRFEIDIEELSVSARFDAASLRVECAVEDGRDAPQALSEGDCKKIERAIQDDVLIVRRYPDIRFRSQRVSPEGSGYLVTGELTLCGVTRPLTLRSAAAGANQLTEVPLHQPDFGIRPYTALLGALRIHPDVVVRLRVPIGPMPA